jgi:exopolysaccharide biosynthesis polyprenyl glycosylphosphotransferase
VASQATFQDVPVAYPAAFPSRLIPGGDYSNQSRRKKIACSLDFRTLGTEWTRNTPRAKLASARQGLSNFLLPAPATANARSILAIQVFFDFICIAFGLALIGIGRALILSSVMHQPTNAASCSPLLSSTLLYGTIFTLLGYSERLYHSGVVDAPQSETLILIKVTLWSTLITCLGLLGMAQNPAAAIAVAAPVNWLSLLACRRARRRIASRQSADRRNVVIVGANLLGSEISQRIQLDPSHRRIVRGFLDDNHPIAGVVLGRVADLAEIARKEFIDEVILAVPQHSHAAREALRQSRKNRLDVKLVPDLIGTDPAQATFDTFGEIPVLTLREEPIPVLGLKLKRGIDAIASAIALVLAFPLMAAIAAVIKLESPGPVFYCAPRVGRKGQRFLCYKFRTMVAGADNLKEKLRQRNQRQGAFFKIEDDPRITRMGRIIRRYSLDELPQLWNVLRGDMSLVGPRPHPLDDFDRYRLEDFHRLDVMPGITGLWQVTARKNASFELSMALDREYIGRWSLKLDLWILCKTVGIVLRGEGS